MDKVTKIKRSEIMAKVRSTETKPELIVRKLTHELGYRLRKNVKNLPGKPDLASKIRKKVIFVHGCFWHRHHGCKAASTPVTNMEYWGAKFSNTIARDKKNALEYKRRKWSILIIWECETKNITKLQNKLQTYLSKD